MEPDRTLWNASTKKLRDFYDLTPNAPIYEKEFGFYVLDKWISQGYLKPRDQVEDYQAYLREVFELDEPAVEPLKGLGGCWAGLCPEFEVKVLEDRGKYELVQDVCGRGVLYFKGRRDGFMPTYERHPVHDLESFEKNIKWRMDPTTPERDILIKPQLERAVEGQKRGHIVTQWSVGGYMYLRSLMGAEELLYMFYDDPDLIHACMKQWFELADARTAYHQKFVVIDELALDEDICYNSGPLISPDMIREFLLPYYQQLYENVRRRNRDNRRVRFQLATDGKIQTIMDLYGSIGVDYFSPFEVASGCDVVKLGQQYPDVLIGGGIDKRMIALGGDDIKRHLDYIMPAMRRRGGYLPTCDHGVPEEVSFENYLLYRKLMKEYCR